jgi:hypothetical protein
MEQVEHRVSIFRRLVEETGKLRMSNRELTAMCDRLAAQNKELLDELISTRQDFERSFGQACPQCGHTEQNGRSNDVDIEQEIRRHYNLHTKQGITT